MSAPLVGLLQAVGLSVYIALVATFFRNAVGWFGPMDNFMSPIVFLTLLSTSVLVCGFIALGYPIKLFFVAKKPRRAIKIVGLTTGFLFLFLLLFIAALALF